MRVYGVVGDVEGLAAPQVLVRHGRGLLAVDLVREVDVATLHEPAWKAYVDVNGIYTCTYIAYMDSGIRFMVWKLTYLLVAAL